MSRKLPLAERLRPKQLKEVVGQEHLVGDDGFLQHVIRTGSPLSILLWGPPGCGKTSIARLYAKAFNLSFYSISAVNSGIADLKKLFKETSWAPLFNQSILLFVDEIHRFNKAQQDAFLPLIEEGSVILVGATAENPSFYLNSALLSRLRVLTLNALDESALKALLVKSQEALALAPLTDEIQNEMIQLAQGDGRYLLNLMENLHQVKSDKPLTVCSLRNILQKRAALFDKEGDQHYNLISALHKSVRGSDPDAALYWFARILEGGEEPLYLARRLIRMAAEDIGLADPHALSLTVAARDAYEMLGSPEGELALAEAVIYLALAPKSNAVYTALSKAKAAAAATSQEPPPSAILNAPTSLMKDLGYGKGYVYDHDTPNGFSGQNYFPDGFERQTFYKPVERGFEREMSKRLAYFQTLRK